MRTNARRVAAIMMAMAATWSSGCASVDVQKIGPDGQPVGPSGVRFNRSRPYVSVFEPFVVAATPYIVDGQVSPDGQWVVITTTATDAGSDLGEVLRTTGQSIPASRVLLTSPEIPGAGDGSFQSTGDDTATNDAKDPEKTGQGSLNVTNDNAAFAVQPLRRYCDIVFLPDFDEEFVVQVEERFGNASASLALGQGWSMQGLDYTVDNSAITDRVFALYDESIKILLGLGKTALGIPGPLGGSFQSASNVETATGNLPAGTPVSLKITIVRVVAPGLYPILKPAEGRYINENIASLKANFPGLASRILIPVYPMTNIAFNTYTVAVVEAVRPVGDSPLSFHRYEDETGTGATKALKAKPQPSSTKDLTNAETRGNVENALTGLVQAAVGEPVIVTLEATSASSANVNVATPEGGRLPSSKVEDARAALTTYAEQNGLTLVLNDG